MDDANDEQREACYEYYKSDAYAAMNMGWQYFFYLAENDNAYRNQMEEFQRENFCCGLGAPEHCMVRLKLSEHILHIR